MIRTNGTVSYTIKVVKADCGDISGIVIPMNEVYEENETFEQAITDLKDLLYRGSNVIWAI